VNTLEYKTMEVQAMSVIDFCDRHSISRPMLYKLLREGKGPRTMRIGSRQYISAEAAADWRRAREAEEAQRRAAEVVTEDA
jgi:predicted DNA-binding transcriptional regulator AlpA